MTKQEESDYIRAACSEECKCIREHSKGAIIALSESCVMAPGVTRGVNFNVLDKGHCTVWMQYDSFELEKKPALPAELFDAVMTMNAGETLNEACFKNLLNWFKENYDCYILRNGGSK